MLIGITKFPEKKGVLDFDWRLEGRQVRLAISQDTNIWSFAFGEWVPKKNPEENPKAFGCAVYLQPGQAKVVEYVYGIKFEAQKA